MDPKSLRKSVYQPSFHLLAQHFSLSHRFPTSSTVNSPSKLTVFERLSQRKADFRLFQREIYPNLNASIRRKTGNRVEDELMEWKKKSDERLTRKRAETVEKELREVQSAPRISDMSRKIVEQMNAERYGLQPQTVDIEVVPLQEERTPRTRVRTTPPAPRPAPQPLPSPRDMSQSEANMLRASLLHSTPSRNSLGIPTPTEHQAKQAALHSLRSQVLTKFLHTEPESPPNYANMPFTERFSVYNQRKNRKIEDIIANERKKEREECIFEPIFYARVPHRRQKSSTSALLRISQARSPVSRPSSRNSLSHSQYYYENYHKRLAETLRVF